MLGKIFREYKHQNLITINDDMFYINTETKTAINIKDPLFQYLITHKIISTDIQKSPSTHIAHNSICIIINIFLIQEISDIVIEYMDNVTNKSCGHLCDNYSKSCCECDDKREIDWINGVSISKNKKYIDGTGQKDVYEFTCINY